MTLEETINCYLGMLHHDIAVDSRVGMAPRLGAIQFANTELVDTMRH